MNVYFNVIQPILMAIIWCILYFNLGFSKLTRKKGAIFFFIAVSISALAVLSKIESIGSIFSLILLFIFEYHFNKKLYRSFLIAILYIAAMILVDMIAGGIVLWFFNFSIEEVRNLVVPNIILYSVSIILAMFISKVISSLLNYNNFELKNIKINKMLYVYVFITVLVMYLNVTIVGRAISHLSIYVICLLIIIFALYCILGIAFAYMMHQNYMKNMELDMRNQENDRLVGYANLLEKQYDDLRVFKHDYMNILATMGGYIQLKDIDKLDKYFKDKILNGGELFKEDKNLRLIKKIQSIPARGMLYAKLISAQKAEVDLELSIINDIPCFNVNELDICKILGILIDNAIEATCISKEKKLLLSLYCDEKSINICINNTFCGDIKNINLLYNKGYSTKGEGRGLGLHTVKSLLDSQYKNAKLTTNIEGNRFIQQFILPITTEEI
ncbi:sensor histidine kinase [Cellulosilyticum sp. I15G10I2]|uniref:sensor histidine kinase n=1 Tax=Cellulosilyticum sp. I15G10I2 TaxID=1892843 RepID=UPI00085C15CD|nr:GHKL domain-containing protein [Cellulosilyticum sp. I15G10I2]